MDQVDYYQKKADAIKSKTGGTGFSGLIENKVSPTERGYLPTNPIGARFRNSRAALQSESPTKS